VRWLTNSVSPLTQEAGVERGAARGLIPSSAHVGVVQDPRSATQQCLRSSLSIPGGKSLMLMDGLVGGRWLFEPGGFPLDLNPKSKQSNRDSVGPC
jgi:hypothetical protein